jgi:rod shape-determining protein MreC
MPLGTLDRTPPPFFRQGMPPAGKMLVLSAFAVVLMVVDVRLHWGAPIRATVATILYPIQWLTLQPVRAWHWLDSRWTSLEAARREAQQAQAQLVWQAQRAGLVEFLEQENQELRRLLALRDRLATAARGAEILYALPDPYVSAVVIDRGTAHDIKAGMAVMDGYGVLGQVTRTYPATSEVTLLVHHKMAIPVLNTRTGERYLAFGTGSLDEPELSLRFVPVQTETRIGDVLVTSGIDGLYPAGLPVATVHHVSASGSEGFAEVLARPTARVRDARHVLVLTPVQTMGQTQEARP